MIDGSTVHVTVVVNPLFGDLPDARAIANRSATENETCLLVGLREAVENCLRNMGISPRLNNIEIEYVRGELELSTVDLIVDVTLPIVFPKPNFATKVGVTFFESKMMTVHYGRALTVRVDVKAQAMHSAHIYTCI